MCFVFPDRILNNYCTAYSVLLFSKNLMFRNTHKIIIPATQEVPGFLPFPFVFVTTPCEGGNVLRSPIALTAWDSLVPKEGKNNHLQYLSASIVSTHFL